MTKLSYDICLNGRKVKNVVSYTEAVEAVKELGKGWSYKAVYTEVDPHDTPEYRKACAEHARKVQEALARKRYEKELAHAPAYVNNSGVGAS